MEEQSEKYAVGLPDDLPAHHRPIPFVFESNSARTAFTNGLDPAPRSRHVFNFPRPETLAEWSALPKQVRARLRALPPLDDSRLWSVQGRALRNLEESLGQSDQRGLIQMATGSGKTFTAVNAVYRLLKHGGARRILFRSIYNVWSQALLYFDAFLVGLTATPDNRTIAFFNQNLVMQYGHDEAVIDGVNVDFDVYRIRTKVTEQGATIEADGTGVYVEKRNKLTRWEPLERLKDDLTYAANQLDRDVVSESQIRTVLQGFRDKVLPEAFPGRGEVPKTLIFAKDDSHADDIVRIAREVFAEGNDFCRKITYRTGFTKVTRTVREEDDASETEVTDWVKTSSLTPDEILPNFRLSFFPRIAVTVDMISTGTDVKPIECVFFMRNVASAGFFEQMKGRGVRVISPDKLRAVTPSARVKDRFIVVDAVGVCERDKTDLRPLDRQPSRTLAQVLSHVARGGINPDALTTLAARLARLQRRLGPAELGELKDLAVCKSIPGLARGLLHACDPDVQSEAAKEQFGVVQPLKKQIDQAAKPPEKVRHAETAVSTLNGNPNHATAPRPCRHLRGGA